MEGFKKNFSEDPLPHIISLYRHGGGFQSFPLPYKLPSIRVTSSGFGHFFLKKHLGVVYFILCTKSCKRSFLPLEAPWTHQKVVQSQTGEATSQSGNFVSPLPVIFCKSNLLLGG
jgi:hypothetical protein